ncbi:MAG: hypothetical protein LBE92_10340 [Chryseobacterium sp.]|uniref:hypothetical protein n=1 Tax=Chryseobacterium sp. TaxID=1871047 RepID=UPI002816EE70|nr:hypothetical protein [Chryseobacterium sp.]MDR2236514.1 hypothetical protein [Chryseobacterium sp.]
MLVGLSAFSQAQQGRVGINTSTPAATLDVTANVTDNARPDALLVPRMTVAQLAAKDDTANTYATPQNGAIVYITAGTGTGARRAKITGPGFYYFDSVVPEWKPMGGGAVATPIPTWRNDNASNVLVLASDANNYVRLTGGSATLSVTLPAPTPDMVGKVFTVFETTGAAAPGILTAGGTYRTTNVPAVNPSGGYQFITDGTDWYNTGSN